MHAAVQLITLTTDFGLHDPYVGIMKSRIALRAPAAHIIDLTHQITPFYPEEAGYWLDCCASQFPAGTVHVAVVDPGVGSERGIVVVEAAEQCFIAPDNGLLGLVAAQRRASYRLEPAALARLGLQADSATFHGRDIMAPLAAELAAGRVRAAELGAPCEPLPGQLQRARRDEAGGTCGQIAVIDRYGNALSTIPGAALRVYQRPRVRVAAAQPRLVRTYAQGRQNECLALINSQDRLELAVREGSAAALLNIRPGQPVYIDETPSRQGASAREA